MLWRYEVIRLEDMSSTDLLATDSLPLIAMMGLSKLRHPQDMLKGLDKLRKRRLIIPRRGRFMMFS
ncbi:MAG: hypothetical protein R2880_20790 [Deinococcales bacterium]